MSSVREILGNIKERVSNPLVFSFIVSWAVINWRITVALLWYDVEQIKNEAFKSIFELIEHELNAIDMFLLPVSFALIYTFGMPPFRVLVDVFNSKISKWGEEWNIKILKTGKVSMEKFLSYRNRYQEQSDALEQIIEKESESINRLAELTNEVIVLQNQNRAIQHELVEKNNEISKITDLSKLSGTWKVVLVFSEEHKIQDIVRIVGNQGFKQEDEGMNPFFTVHEFHYFKQSNSLFFKRHIDTRYKDLAIYKREILPNFLRENYEGSLSGEEFGCRITYTKIES